MAPEAPRPIRRRLLAGAVLVAIAAVIAGVFLRPDAMRPDDKGKPSVQAVPAPAAGTAARPALSVALIRPGREDWPHTFAAQGNITAWQEAAVGAELSGFRITEVLVNVGDRVRRGQPLARVNADSVLAEVGQARASVTEAEAVLAEARANARRSRELAAKGFVSPQAATQSATAEETAAARLSAARARLAAEEVRLAQTRVVAPDDGTISARNATVGAQTQPGQELFRLIRGNRLEWRAEVTASELGRIKPGMAARISLPNGQEAAGKVRTVAPTVDTQTRTAVVYVDLPAAPNQSARAGMFARGTFDLGRGPALTLPQSAVAQREGFAYVFRVETGQRVAQTKVGLGRRVGDRVEVTEGLAPDTEVVASGVGFLADGDVVRVVPADAASQR